MIIASTVGGALDNSSPPPATHGETRHGVLPRSPCLHAPTNPKETNTQGYTQQSEFVSVGWVLKPPDPSLFTSIHIHIQISIFIHLPRTVEHLRPCFMSTTPSRKPPDTALTPEGSDPGAYAVRPS